jgi:hypothetical protein
MDKKVDIRLRLWRGRTPEIFCLAMGDGTERIGNQLLNLRLTLKSMIRLITIYEDCLLV